MEASSKSWHGQPMASSAVTSQMAVPQCCIAASKSCWAVVLEEPNNGAAKLSSTMRYTEKRLRS